MKRAIIWLLDRVHEARPDLYDRNVAKSVMFKQRARIVEEVSQQMEKLSRAALAVTDEDLASDVESDDDSDDSDDEEGAKQSTQETPMQEESDDRPASVLPPKPPPTLVDLLLPPGKPPADILNASSWSHIAGAAVCRILHRYKRLRNEVDDSLRNSRELPRLSVAERRTRESFATSRVFTESCASDGSEDHCERAVEHLCSGGEYLDLSTQQRLCILRILIEAAYDTARVYEVVDSNYKQRTNAAKALDVEQRKAKKAAKEKSAADEAAARGDLADEARRTFIEEKREEIRRANDGSPEFSKEEIDALTDEDIIEFDEDIKADFDALPTADSFKKAEVLERVAKIQEAAAFETEKLRVITMDELMKREEAELTTMEGRLESVMRENLELDSNVDKDTPRSIERLRRDVEKLRASSQLLPQQRGQAVDTLRDAIADGTLKSLRNAIRVAKAAKLYGVDDETNGVWTLDVVRDAHIELFNAKQLKRVADAQKELILKLNKCFVRTEPLGRDRFRNRFWHFDMGERGHIWAEADYLVTGKDPEGASQPGFQSLMSSIEAIEIGAADIEEDLAPAEEEESVEEFRRFSRLEYHASGATPCLVRRHWGCHATDFSLRTIMKTLDGRGMRENHLKTNLKDALEDKATTPDGQAVYSPDASEPTNVNSSLATENPEEDVEPEFRLQEHGDRTGAPTCERGGTRRRLRSDRE